VSIAATDLLSFRISGYTGVAYISATCN
jgi:hypothetical protein